MVLLAKTLRYRAQSLLGKRKTPLAVLDFVSGNGQETLSVNLPG
jgi:hypothetical protein